LVYGLLIEMETSRGVIRAVSSSPDIAANLQVLRESPMDRVLNTLKIQRV